MQAKTENDAHILCVAGYDQKLCCDSTCFGLVESAQIVSISYAERLSEAYLPRLSMMVMSAAGLQFTRRYLTTGAWFCMAAACSAVEPSRLLVALTFALHMSNMKSCVVCENWSNGMEPVRIHHSSHTQPSHFVDRALFKQKNGFYWISDTTTWCTQTPLEH